MALFKIFKGLKANLPSTKTAGYCWYTIDDSLFYIDYEDENGVVQRKALNSQDAQTLCGASLSTIVTESDSKIPTSQAVLSAIAAAVSNAINNLNTTIQAKLNDKAPKYTYGTTDLIEGTSTLPAGTLYFYYTTD